MNRKENTHTDESDATSENETESEDSTSENETEPESELDNSDIDSVAEDESALATHQRSCIRKKYDGV